MTSSRPQLTVVVSTKDRPDTLSRTLEALLADSRSADEVIVVDSASAGEATRAVAERFGVGYLRADLPGTSRARNLGWRAARNEVVAFLDDDVLAADGWARAMGAAFDDAGVAFVSGRINPPEGYDTRSALSVFADDDPRTIDRDTRGILGMSGNTAVRRSALLAIGGFDPRLGPATWFGTGEDNDFFDRLVRAGYRGRYEPAAAVVHLQGHTGRSPLAAQWNYGKGMGARLAKAVWRDGWRARTIVPEVTRLGGVRTAVTDVRSGERRKWGPPIAWRLGALAGFFVGLIRLHGEHES
ncbi:MAG: glycosyltransferase [Actinomycetes bacterium]